MFSRRYFPLPIFFPMDSLYIDPSDQDSCQRRSRSNSHLSSTASQLQSLNIIDSSNPSTNNITRLASSAKPQPFASLNQERRDSPSSFISAPAPHQPTSFPILTQDEFDWTFNQQKEPCASAPLLRLDPAEYFPEEPSNRRTSYHSSATPANMSTVAIQQYDSNFDAGYQGIRQSFTWPNFDMNFNQQFFQVPSPNLGGPLTPFEEPKLMPMYARSLSSSPPRGSLTPEQRELKKQRDTARRDSKTRLRRDRSTSNPYIVSTHGSPNLIPGALPEFTNSLSPSPLLSQGSPAMSSSSFLAPFPTQLGADGVQNDLYVPVYTMGPNDFTTPAYNMPYSEVLPTLQSQPFVPRSHSLSSSSDHQIYQLHPQQQQPQISTTAKLESGEHVRLLHNRPKPQCWDHGCNGRQFSTFSNLLRHQREKSGAATKSSCPNCGAEFTRTTARNGHMAHEKCKQRRDS